MTRCIDGRLMRADPQPDDPYLETDVGVCPECGGIGCDRPQGREDVDNESGQSDWWAIIFALIICGAIVSFLYWLKAVV